MLAALAERDLLRHVDVLSCVSGGSILGAYYYLEMRKLLQDREDGEIERDDYVKLVERVHQGFLAGVQQNIRMRIGSSLCASLRMMFKPGYTTSNRLSDLYQDKLYAQIEDDGKRLMRELQIKPKGDENCNPKYDNWQRVNKVPILILNATTVNTGHNWQFTASWMGEPPTFIDSEIDGNYRLRRMYLDGEAPPPHCDISLGDAVAASSCVPGLFAPLELRGLYEDDVTVRLVDGGVHDNQGVFGLIEQNCSVLIVSDASGQMEADDNPEDDPLKILSRTSSMLQARVRAAQYREIEARRRSGLLKGLMFLHLRKGLDAEDRDWLHCENPKHLTADDLHQQRSPLTEYGVLKKFQRLIAGIRTDLDSFNDTEAFALIASGYKMAAANIESSIQGLPIDPGRHSWTFLQMDERLSKSSDETLESVLKAAGATLLKVWSLSDPLRWLKSASKMAAWVVVGLVLLTAPFLWGGQPSTSLKAMAAAPGIAVVAIAFYKFGLGPLLRLIGYRKTAHQLLIGAGLSTVGWIVAWLHILIFDRAYLRHGKVDNTPASTGEVGQG